MSEEPERSRKNYHYQYVSCSVTPKEKEIVHEAAKKENFKTISDFLRRIVFGHIRKQENPELFLSNGNDSANTLLLEKIDKSVKELQNNQEKIMVLEHTIETMKEGIADLKYMIQINNNTEERKKIIGLLEKHTSLSLEQLRQLTELPEEILLQIIWDNRVFRKTERGRIALV